MRLKERRHAFDLIELAVILAAAAVFTALALPFVKNAMDKARLAGCRGHLQALTFGVFEYVEDNNGFIMARDGNDCNHNYGGFGAMPGKTFRDALPEQLCRSLEDEVKFNTHPVSNPTKFMPLNPYVRDTTTLACPADDRMFLRFGTSYLINRNWDSGNLQAGEAWTLGGNNARTRGLLFKVFSPDSTVLLGDMSMHYWWGGAGMVTERTEYNALTLFHQRLNHDRGAMANSSFSDGHVGRISPKLKDSGEAEDHGLSYGAEWKFFPGKQSTVSKGAYTLE